MRKSRAAREAYIQKLILSQRQKPRNQRESSVSGATSTRARPAGRRGLAGPRDLGHRAAELPVGEAQHLQAQGLARMDAGDFGLGDADLDA